ncbi:MAG: hypothetical protein OFPI_31610 [Osedax symbiont Rs2]|nr:MAG: hypothetical protein OFPI_31610 [Osedax symbiont Rs2]
MKKSSSHGFISIYIGHQIKYYYQKSLNDNESDNNCTQSEAKSK